MRSSHVGFALFVMLTACGTDPDAPTLDIDYQAHGAYADPGRFRAEVRQGTSIRTISGSQLAVRQQSAEFFAGARQDLRITAGTPLTVTASIALADGSTLDLPVSLTPRKNTDYGVGVVVDARRPQGFCFQVEQAAQLPPLGASTADSVFVLVSWLERGAIC